MRHPATVLVLTAAVLATPAHPAPPVFSSSIDLVRLEIVVQDANGRYINTLTQDDFTVWENGVKQEVVSFNHAPVPIDLTLMIDGSDSMQSSLKEVYKAAAQFIAAIHPDTVQIIQFSQSVRVLREPTDDMVEIQGFLGLLALFAEEGIKAKTLDTHKPENIVRREALKEWLCNRSMCGSTALYSSIYAVNNYIQRRARDDVDERRQIIILLTDGEDSSSTLTDDDVIAQVAQLEIPIYVIGLRMQELGQAPYDPQRVDHFLTALTEKTGGAYTIISHAAELGGRYRQIADDLQSQYRISYAASDVRHDGGWRTIQVSANRTGATLRHKQGYYAPCEPRQPCASQKH